MYAWERGQLTLAAESMGAGGPRSQAGRPRAQAGRLRSHWQRGRDALAPRRTMNADDRAYPQMETGTYRLSFDSAGDSRHDDTRLC